LGLQENVGRWVAAAQDLALYSGFVEYSFLTWMNLAGYHCDTVYPWVLNISSSDKADLQINLNWR